MLRIFSIFMFVLTLLVFTPIDSSTSFAADIEDTGKSEEELMQEIHDLLESESKKNEVLKEEEVKVDIESLGLDDLDGVEEVEEMEEEFQPEEESLEEMTKGILSKDLQAIDEVKEEVVTQESINDKPQENDVLPMKDVIKDDPDLTLPNIPTQTVEKTVTVTEKVGDVIEDTGKSEEDIMQEINDLLEAENSKNEIFKDEDVKVDIKSLEIEEEDIVEEKEVTKEEENLDEKIESENLAEKEEQTVQEGEVEEVNKKPEAVLSLPVTPVTPVKKVNDVKKKRQNKREFEQLKEQNLKRMEAIIPVPKEAESQKDTKLLDVVKTVKDEKKEAVIVKSKVAGGSKKTPQKPSSLSRIQKFLNKTINKTGQVDASSSEDSNQKEKKSEIKKAKRKLTKNEQMQKDKLQKLNRLREKYLIKIDSKNSSNLYHKAHEDFSDDNIKIIPKRRGINKFSLYEVPAPPIADKYRTKDNLHIPKIVPYGQKIAILFNAIKDSDNISYFKSAYEDVGRSDIKNHSGDTILTYAMLLQRHSIVASMLSLGADPNLPSGLGYTPLGIAIEVGDSVSLKLLVDHSADINYVDAFGRTYLMHAARAGFLPAVDLLISKGVDVNAMDNDGFTALAIAYRHKKDVIVKFLLKNGAKTWVEKPYDSSSQSLIKELDNRWKN